MKIIGYGKWNKGTTKGIYTEGKIYQMVDAQVMFKTSVAFINDSGNIDETFPSSFYYSTQEHYKEQQIQFSEFLQKLNREQGVQGSDTTKAETTSKS